MSPSVLNSLVWSCREFDEDRCQQQAVDALDEQHGIYYSVLFLPEASVQGQQLLLAAHSTGYIRLVDWQATNAVWVENKQQLGCVHSQWKAHSAAVFRLAIHAQGGWLVSCSDDGYVRLWSLAAIAAAATAAGSRAAGDSTSPAAAGGVAELHLAPIAEVQLPHAPPLFGVGSPEQPAAQALAIDTQQHRAYVGASDGGCYSIDLQALAAGRQGQQCLQPLTGHLAGVLDASWSPATQQLATGSEDGTLRVWDTRTCGAVSAVVPSAARALVPGDASAALDAVRKPAVGAVAHSGDGSFLVAGSSNATLALWDCRMAAIARQDKTDRSVPQALLVQPAAIYMAGSAPELHRYSFLLKPQERHALRTTAHCFGLDLEEGRGLLAVGGSRGCLELHSTITGDVAGAVRVPGMR